MSKLENLKTSLSRQQRILLLIALILVVFGVLTATVFRDHAVNLIRRISYTQNAEDFPHNAQTNSLFLGINDNLLVCTQSQLQLLSPSGTSRLKQTVTMSAPALNAAGKYAVVYDVGGQELSVVEGEKLLYELELPAEEALLCATINDKGWMAVTSKVSGYKGVVTVYNSSFEPVLAIRLSSRYISDAVVTPDCRGVYLIAPGQSGGTFENSLLYYTFSSKDKPVRELSLGSNVVLSILSRGKCWILGDKSLFILDSSGVITATYDYEGQYLKMGSLQGNDFASLFLSHSASGSAGTLITVGSNGEPYGKLSLDGQALALAAQGRTVAILTTGEIITTDRDLKHYTKEANQRGAKNLAVYQDGSVALINSATVSLFFPSMLDQLDNEEATQ